MDGVKIITFEGRFDFPFDAPMMLHHMPARDGETRPSIGFELMGDEARFYEVLSMTPECNDFRRLGNGDWVAYSTVLDENKSAIRALGKTIYEALMNLRELLPQYAH